MTEKYDVAIIGGGPAGASAAIYTSRRNLKTIILEKGLIGGLINTAPLLENYPGFDTAPGLKFGMKLQEQLDKLKVEVEMQEIYDKLTKCKVPKVSPDGQKTLTIVGIEEIENMIKSNK